MQETFLKCNIHHKLINWYSNLQISYMQIHWHESILQYLITLSGRDISKNQLLGKM